MTSLARSLGLRTLPIRMEPVDGRYPNAAGRERRHARYAWRVDDDVRETLTVCDIACSCNASIDFVYPDSCYLDHSAALSEAVRAELISQGVLDNSAVVVIAGPANTYGHYVATPEEYTVQRYEGASTLYGPRTFLKKLFCSMCLSKID